MKKLYDPKPDIEASRIDLDNALGVNDDSAVRGLTSLYSPDSAQQAVTVKTLADILFEQGKISDKQLEDIQLKSAQDSSKDIETIIKDSKVAGKDDILAAKAQLYGFEFKRIDAETVDKEAFEKLDINYVRTSRVIPIGLDGSNMIVATSDPSNVFMIDDVKRKTGLSMQVVVCPDEDIDTVCDELDEAAFGGDVDDIINDMAEVELVQEEDVQTEDIEKDLAQSAGQSPVIKFVNYVLSNALHEGASDIHIEPKAKTTKIRYRIDGVLFNSLQAPVKMHPAIVSRLKIMSNLDISERRLPQDGKIAVIMGGRPIDLRVSVLPCSHGEKVVIRLLDSKSILRGLDQSGMEPDIMAAFQEQIELPHGILLVTGPTGSGKSTTLYSAMAQMDGASLNISTVEDPVEYDLEFCNQVQVLDHIGLTFASALRSLLRQDPDIMMIGEIRDNETARIAVQAALTGHLVLSTLHTNDAPSSVSRLVDIGIEPYLISASLNAVLAQRLVRRICSNCKEVYKVPEKMKKLAETYKIKPSELMHGKGCDKCRDSGYQGRAGIYELMIVDENIRDIINKDSSVNAMKHGFIASKQKSLFDDGMEKVRKGVTTIEEVLRVTEVYGQNEEEVFIENTVPETKPRRAKKATTKKATAKKATTKKAVAKKKTTRKKAVKKEDTPIEEPIIEVAAEEIINQENTISDMPVVEDKAKENSVEEKEND